jgi:hypothetical protein
MLTNLICELKLFANSITFAKGFLISSEKSEAKSFTVYDPSGVFTDQNYLVKIDLNKGLPKLLFTPRSEARLGLTS